MGARQSSGGSAAMFIDWHTAIASKPGSHSERVVPSVLI